MAALYIRFSLYFSKGQGHATYSLYFERGEMTIEEVDKLMASNLIQAVDSTESPSFQFLKADPNELVFEGGERKSR